MTEEPRVIRGTVSRLFHQSPTFCAGRLLAVRSDAASPSGEVVFAGKVYVRQGEAVALKGKWVDHEKYGRQFSVSERIAEESYSAEGLAGWLQVHGAAHGIGKVKAAKLAKEFGENFAGWLRDDPEQVAITVGVPLETVKALAKSWLEQEELNTVGVQLAKYQLTANQIHTLFTKFKGSVVAILDENPYLLIGEVSGLGFKKVDEIAMKVGVPPEHLGRLDAAIVYVLNEAAEGDGSTCLDMDSIADGVVKVMSLAGTTEQVERIVSRVGELCDPPDGKRPSVVKVPSGTRPWYALPWNYRYEKTIADFLASSGSENPHWDKEEAEEAVRSSEFTVSLDDSQRRAVLLALTKRACLISGGAGSGKTTLIKAIANLYRSHGKDVRHTARTLLREGYGEDDWDRDFGVFENEVASSDVILCAPTGKAARRMEEVVVGFDAATIHRTLEYRPKLGGFQRHAGNPLTAAVVIVDETSMVASDLAFHLLQAVGPNTAIVFVGDHHQLPPVGPGALLRDAISRELLPMVILNQCHRQAGPLKQNCQAVLAGTVAATVKPDGEGAGPWYVHRELHTAESVLGYIEKRLYAEVLSGKLGYHPIGDVQFLTAQHKGPVGTLAINALLQRLHQKSLGVDVQPVEPGRRPPLMVGDKVIQTRNNYDLDVMNGHQGFVLSLKPLVVRFGDRDVTVPNDSVGDVELAYCLSVHKVQGSEFPCVVVLCHSKNSFSMHRNWLYTGCTRARKTCILLGDNAGLDGAVKTIKNNQRRTLLGILANHNLAVKKDA